MRILIAKIISGTFIGIWAIWKVADIIGRGDALVSIPEKAEAFHKFLEAHDGLTWNMAPWAMLVLGIIGFSITLLWPRLFAGHPQSAAFALDLKPVEQTHYPDWTVRELFIHLAPGLEVAQLDQTHERIGQEIQNQLSLGRLRAWGAMVNNPTVVPIPKEYWVHAQFTYIFLGKEEGLNHVWSTRIREGHEHTGQPQYRSVEINKSEALGIWPKAIEELIPMKEAATRLYEQARKHGSVWAYAAEKLGAHGLTGTSTEAEVLDYLSHFIANKIVLFGVKPPSRLFEAFPHGAFKSGVFKECGNEFWTHTARTASYKELQANAQEVDFVIQIARLGLNESQPI